MSPRTSSCWAAASSSWGTSEMVKPVPSPDRTTTTPSEASPLRRKGFVAYYVAVFLNAFNDNAFKLIVSLVLLRSIPSSTSEGGVILSVIGALFIIPFLLFSSWAGALADKYSKRTVFIVMQLYGVFGMLLAAVAFHFGAFHLVLAALFWAGAQSAFYSPAKYGILPETLPVEHLSRANGVLEAATFGAIVLGTAFGGAALHYLHGDPTSASLACAVLAALAWLVSLAVPPAPAVAPEKKIEWRNPFGDIFRRLSESLPKRSLGAPMIGLAFFWFLGQMVYFATLLFARSDLFNTATGADFETQTSILMTTLSIGIGVGSLVAGRWSRNMVEIGLVPLGELGTAVGLVLIATAAHGLSSGVVTYLFLGFASGLFIVPLQAAVQERAPRADRGGVLAASNFLVFSAVLAASAIFAAVEKAGISPRTLFLLLGFATLVIGILLCLWLAEFVVRFSGWLLTTTIYRLRILGREHIPATGGAVLVSNHVSFIDALLIGSAIERPIRFLMLEDYYNHRLFHPFCRLMRAIPIAPGRRESVRAALREAANAAMEGELVCIFAEGQITRTGLPTTFRRGFETVADTASVPVIPVHLDGVWGSIFSFSEGRLLWKIPRRIPYPVTVSLGQPLPSRTKADTVRQSVLELGAEAMRLRAARHRNLTRALLRAARLSWFRTAVQDTLGSSLPFGRLVAVSHVFAQTYLCGRQNGSESTKTEPKENRRAEDPEDPESIGILLPAGTAAAMVNIACTLCGKISVNLNFTASAEALGFAVRSARISRIFTSRKFLQKIAAPLPPARVLYLEDLTSSLPRLKIVLWYLLFSFLPLPVIERLLPGSRRQPDDAATVIFSSGSTGTPKGVVLTHANILANVLGLSDVFDTRKSDCILGILPFFHSFGYTGTLWFPLLGSFSAIYHANPLDTHTIGKACRDANATILLTTPTFARAYLRRIPPENFQSLRLAFAGAETLPPEVAKAWEERFSCPLLEGYGATECAPVIAINVPAKRKPGSIGHPLPGVAVRIRNPETQEECSTGEEGILWVKGANVMKGYLRDPDRTAEVLRDGWYRTGDVAVLEKDGFLRIVGRLERFSKIGGEMVPHGRVEEAVLDHIARARKADDEPSRSGPPAVVTGRRDASGREELVVLHTLELDPREVVNALREEYKLPNLWIPKPTAFRRVDEIPLLGTGKIDLAAVKRLAEEK
ncbi:MAG: MFS transporter [Candidatus Hydrogenedentota bacterium]|nr:MAG: MFS transporter [Candidatus Hydrogenedentota bacterium]